MENNPSDQMIELPSDTDIEKWRKDISRFKDTLKEVSNANNKSRIQEIIDVFDYWMNFSKVRDKKPITKPATGKKETAPKGTATQPEPTMSQLKTNVKQLNTKVEKLQRELHETKKRMEDAQLQLKIGIEENKRLNQQLGDVTNRLAKEMQVKVGADEKNLENVGIKNRPMNVADEYNKICSYKWLEAKTLIDEKMHSDTSRLEQEEYKLIFLRDLILKCEAIAKMKYKELMVRIYLMIFVHADTITAIYDVKNKVKMEIKSPSKTDVPEEEYNDLLKTVPDNLKIAIGDFLRVAADEHDVGSIVHDITEQMIQGIAPDTSKSEADILSSIITDDIIKSYIGDCAQVSWKMMLQRPQMNFDISGEGEKWRGDKEQEPYYISVKVSDPGSVVKCYVYPGLWHATQLMVKGKVYINTPTK